MDNRTEKDQPPKERSLTPSALHVALSPESWPEFLSPLVTPALTLIGFEGRDLAKMYDALDVCAKHKNIQAVEVFIRSQDEVFELEMSVPSGLCLVKIPDPEHIQENRRALTLLSELTENDTLTVLPVLKPYVPNGDRLDSIGAFCCAYLNVNSDVRDFASLFSAFMFPVPEPRSSSHLKLIDVEAQRALTH